jgi:hypothetical protein
MTMNQTERIVLNCAACGAQVPIVADVCPKCGKPTQVDGAKANAVDSVPSSMESVDPGVEPKGLAAIGGSLLMAAGLLTLMAAFTNLLRPGTFVSNSKAMTMAGIVLGLIVTAVGVAVRKNR